MNPEISMTIEQLYRRFASQIAANPAWPNSRRDRTTIVVKALHRIGDSLDASGRCAPYYHGTNGEFMLDACFMDRVSHTMLLAAESELSETRETKIVDDDFQKLVYIRSRFRMLVFDADERKVLARAGDFLREFG